MRQRGLHRAFPLGRSESAALLVLLASLVWGLGWVIGRPEIADETYHRGQILRFSGGHAPILPMFPGYHFLMHLITLPWNKPGLDVYRAFSCALGVGSVGVFYLCMRALDPRVAMVRTLAYAALPVSYPLLFLVYTEPFSHLLMFASFLAVFRRRFVGAGLFGTLSLFVRQTNVAWLGLAFAMTVLDTIGEERAAGRGVVPRGSEAPGLSGGGGGALLRLALSSLRNTWTFLVGFALFGLFVIHNRGLVMHSSFARHTSILTGDSRFYSTNVFTVLLAFGILFLPLVVGVIRAKRHRPASSASPTRRAVIVALLGTAVLLFLTTFHVTHPWNEDPWYLVNRLVGLGSTELGRYALLVVVLASLLALTQLHLYRATMYLLYPVSVVALVPVWLISLRYELTPLVLVLLFVRSPGFRWEWLLAVYFLTWDALLLPGLASGRFFL
ncbi:MAG: hypothetical protein KDA27_17490 [Candidatus Eisenbacteria bacterium]|uniref:Uncharacterized protein n=1 Tax=Eiseniibacteriota bacterium TaxID=2212470 RepID=A0A956NEF7_UNCEI|nr:hypothetical protein [Candidatus Eisenbacteria bacterium]